MPSFNLPDDHRPYTDAYFLHSRAILEGDGFDPMVTYEVFIRDPGKVHGIEEAVAIIDTYAPDLAAKGGSVHALPEGSSYEASEPLMHIRGPVQDLIELETMYLGVLSAQTTRANGGAVDLHQVARQARAIRELCPDKQLIYFGARHWRYDEDAAISKAILDEGWDGASTDVGARAGGFEQGVGTIPHALVLVYAHVYGRKSATLKATQAFHRHMNPALPRIALVDTFNTEIDDALATARALGDDLYAIRLDTPGEHAGQGADPADRDEDVYNGYWGGTGVTVSLNKAARESLDQAGYEHVKIVLSSGFGKLKKLSAFVEGERRHGRLFESLGIGSVYPAMHATADIVRVEDVDLAKDGRGFHPNPRLVRMI
ncbi:MAG: nicotinate phosphoribosyltransferase [Oceanidesulfovibrio sp.]